MQENKDPIKPDWGSVINYCCNRFFPLITIAALLMLTLGPEDWISWIICGLVLFVDRYVFKVGYSVGYCDRANGNDPNIQ